MRPLTGLDAMFLYLETPSSHMHVTGVFVLDPTDAPGGFDFEKVRRMAERRLPFAPPFRRRLVEVPLKLYHPVWIEDPDFDLDYHVRRACLPSPGGHDELAAFVGQIVGLPLDRTKPLWELYLVEGLEGGRYALVTKIHHAAIDGISGAELSASFLDLAPEGDREPPEGEWKPERVPTDFDMLTYAIAALTGHPLAAFRTVRRFVETALHITERNRLPEVQPPPSPFSAPRTRMNQAITPHRRVAFSDIVLEGVKAVKNHVGCTVNDVVLELSAGVLRRYLLSHDELPEEPLVAMVPISVRTDSELGSGGNKVSAMLVSLATDVADPIARLKTIAEGTRHAKDQEKAIGAETLTDWTEFTFPALMGLAARLTSSTKVFDRVRPIFNVTISNVPGPPFPLYLAGAQLVAMHPVGPIHEGIGLNITVMSYLGRMWFGFQACRETVPDLAVFPELLQESLQELLDGIGHKGHDWARMSTTADVTLAAWLADRGRLTPTRRALTFEGTTWTYAELVGRVERTAGALRELGVRHGDRVGYLGLNHPAFFELLFGSARLGAIFVPLNFRLTGPELSFVINDAGVHTLVADEMHRAVIDGVRAELPCRHFLSSSSEGPPAEGWASLAAAAGSAAPFVGEERIDADEVALIMYTSGTTGRPKGAMLTHSNLWWNNVAALLLTDVVESDVSLVCAPLFHIGGLNVTTLQALMKGAEIVLHRSFDAGAFLSDISRYGVTTVFAVPAMLLFVSQHPSFVDADLTTLRSIVCGGAPVPEALIKLYNGRGVQINQGYGLTETSPCATFLTPEFGLAKLGSAGRPPMLVEIKLVDAAGGLVTSPMARGELCVRGPNVMRGYWNRPVETAEAIDPDGWFHTGDVAYADAEGFYYIADRIKDMVITGGENVYPAEVENALHEHPAVVDVAVVGVPDARWGEAVMAVVVVAAGSSLDLEGLRSFAGERLARYKLPTRLEVVDAIPRNPAGKILKFELRERFSAG